MDKHEVNGGQLSTPICSLYMERTCVRAYTTNRPNVNGGLLLRMLAPKYACTQGPAPAQLPEGRTVLKNIRFYIQPLKCPKVEHQSFHQCGTNTRRARKLEIHL